MEASGLCWCGSLDIADLAVSRPMDGAESAFAAPVLRKQHIQQHTVKLL